jgi:hypothetical protein
VLRVEQIRVVVEQLLGPLVRIRAEEFALPQNDDSTAGRTKPLDLVQAVPSVSVCQLVQRPAEVGDVGSCRVVVIGPNAKERTAGGQLSNPDSDPDVGLRPMWESLHPGGITPSAGGANSFFRESIGDRLPIQRFA